MTDEDDTEAADTEAADTEVAEPQNADTETADTDDAGTDAGWGSVPRLDVAPSAISTPAAATSATAASVPATPASADQPDGAGAPGVRRPSRSGRGPGRRARVAIVAGGLALLLVAAAVVSGVAIDRSRYAPERTVEAFLSELRAGHVTRALADAHVASQADDPLLTDAGYAAATHRLTGYRVVSSTTSGGTAMVRVDLDQGGRTVSATFDLVRSGTVHGVFPVWRMQPVSLGRVEVVVSGPPDATLTIAGRRFRTDQDGTLTVAALPGTYRVSAAGSPWVTTGSASARVTGFGDTSSSPVHLTSTLTDEGRSAAVGAVNAWVDGCVASTALVPVGCSFGASDDDPDLTYSHQRWTLDARPAVTIGAWTGSGWKVTTTSEGAATYTADFSGPAGYGTGTAGPVSFTADGTITAFSDAGATFRPSVTNDTGNGTVS